MFFLRAWTTLVLLLFEYHDASFFLTMVLFIPTALSSRLSPRDALPAPLDKRVNPLWESTAQAFDIILLVDRRRDWF